MRGRQQQEATAAITGVPAGLQAAIQHAIQHASRAAGVTRRPLLTLSRDVLLGLRPASWCTPGAQQPRAWSSRTSTPQRPEEAQGASANSRPVSDCWGRTALTVVTVGSRSHDQTQAVKPSRDALKMQRWAEVACQVRAQLSWLFLYWLQPVEDPCRLKEQRNTSHDRWGRRAHIRF